MDDYSKESYLRRILERLPETEDTRESSPLYLMTIAQAYEFEQIHKFVEWGIKQTFPITQDREHLIEFAKTYGITPSPATKAVFEGKFDIKLKEGTRFSKDDYNFVVTEFSKEEEGYFFYLLECEQEGEGGNIATGKLIPIWTVTGLKEAYLTRLVIPGESEEETESFRKRLLDSFIHKPFGGNGTDYMLKLSEIQGVGRSKILRCKDKDFNINPEWTTICFIDSNFRAPEQELIEMVQETFHPLGDAGEIALSGSGTGLAPIGSYVFVRGAKERRIDLGLDISFKNGNNLENLESEIKTTIEAYFELLRGSWGEVLYNENAKFPERERIEIVRNKLISLLLDVDGISDILGITLDKVQSNLTLEWDEIPVVGNIELTEIKTEGDCPCTCPDCPHDKVIACCDRIRGING